MRTIATHDSISLLSVTQVGCEKTAERIDVLFEVETLGDPRNILPGGGGPYPTAGGSMRPLPNYFRHF